LKAGGFRGVYKGLSAAAAGSAPGAALFFSTYETTKNTIHKNDENNKIAKPFVHMISACCGEMVSN
jgi:solute carrier family 25 S-adenosylmethionine transporter 26